MFRRKTVLSKKLYINILILLIVVSTLALIGCTERERKETAAPGSNNEADAALAKAEAEMNKAGIDISFDELQELSDLTAILPNPLELEQMEESLEIGQLEKSIEDATKAMYDTLDALEAGTKNTPAAPMQANEQFVSDTDLALIHLHIAYLYIYDIVIRLVKVRKNPDTDIAMYNISFPEELKTENLQEVYQIELTEEGLRKLEEAQGPEAFTREQRQQIINVLYLLFGTEAQITVEGVNQKHDVDTNVFRRDVLYHFKEALEYAKRVSPEIREAMKELSEIISDEKNFALRMLDRAEIEWGFEILNREEVIRRIEGLVSQ